jgi:hypothetical protein
MISPFRRQGQRKSLTSFWLLSFEGPAEAGSGDPVLKTAVNAALWSGVLSRENLLPSTWRRGPDSSEAFEGCYLVDPASSHMLVSKIKPCMSKYKQSIQRNCEWLIKSVIVYLMVPYYLDNRGNSRANTCARARPLGGPYLLDT